MRRKGVTKTSEEIAAETAAFLARGKEVTELESEDVSAVHTGTIRAKGLRSTVSFGATNTKHQSVNFTRYVNSLRPAGDCPICGRFTGIIKKSQRYLRHKDTTTKTWCAGSGRSVPMEDL